MAKQSSEGRYGGMPDRTAASRVTDDWPVYVAFLPDVVIGIAAAIDFGTATSCAERGSSSAASAKSIPGDADGYVEGLARLGIATIPDRQVYGVIDRTQDWTRW
jgi:hypothetical protein